MTETCQYKQGRKLALLMRKPENALNIQKGVYMWVLGEWNGPVRSS